MQLLIDKIKEAGILRSNDTLDVSSFLNMRIDIELMDEIGRAFAEHYANYDFDMFVTVESSGIAPSVFASVYANKPLVIIKKTADVIPDKLQQPNVSFTANRSYYLTVNGYYIKNRKIILLDDFLAHGNVVLNVEALLQQANSTLVSTGIIISKNFQSGYKTLTRAGKDLFCLAEIKHLDYEKQEIVFK